MQHILIIEDEEFLAKSLKKYLEYEGCQVSLAEDGESGLKEAAETNPDLILLDIGMPKLNGFQVLEKLRVHPTLSSVPVIIISNSGEVSEIKRSQELGIKDYIIKANIDLEEVMKKIRAALQMPPKESVKSEEKSVSPQDSSPEKTSPENTQAAKILFVEDDAFFSKLFLRDLKENGLSADLASDGEEGLARFKEGKYDLVISDIVMPKMSGFDVLKKIREDKDPELAKTPVILLTNLYQKEDIEKGRMYRVDAYFVKTMTDIKEVIAKINEILENHPV